MLRFEASIANIFILYIYLYIDFQEVIGLLLFWRKRKLSNI
jgi:hypothetical protein